MGNNVKKRKEERRKEERTINALVERPTIYELRKRQESDKVEANQPDLTAYPASTSVVNGRKETRKTVGSNGEKRKSFNRISSQCTNGASVNCYNCGGIGYLKVKCPSKNVFTGRYNRCKEYGHKASNCSKNELRCRYQPYDELRRLVLYVQKICNGRRCQNSKCLRA